MKTYIALIRGINVGGRNTLPMKELTALFEAQGHMAVQTYIQSGNVVFQNRKTLVGADARKIEKAIYGLKGFEPRVLILGEADFLKAVNENPFPTDDGKALHFFFLESPPRNPNLERLSALEAASERWELHSLVFYLFAPDGVGRSKLAALVEKVLGVPVSARNWNTVSKLVSMFNGA